MSAGAEAAGARRGAGLFRLADRGLVVVEGSDRVRWLDGMLSNDIAGLAPGPERSGCYALLLSRTGRIVADPRVLLRPDALWLELPRSAVAPVVATLERFIVADDVALRDGSAEVERLSLEGPTAPEILEAALGATLPLAPEACAEVELAGAPTLVAAFGWSGAPARQLFAPPGMGDRLAAALVEAGASRGLVEAGPEALEVLRIEAGVPRLGAELDEDVLPAEARLDRAISWTKGCYTGQEVVARIESRGRVKHRLVGLAVPGGTPPDVGARISVGGSPIGEVTSACLSPAVGAIALGYVRVPHDEPGTRVELAGREARVAVLPFVGAGPG